MPAAPLFVRDTSTLKAELRLSDVTSNDTLTLIAGAMQKARMVLVDHLGSGRVAEIKVTDISDNPLTPAEIMRTKAGACETAIVKLHLLRAMPNLFLEASAAAPQEWNEHPIARESAPRTEKEIQRLQAEIDGYLADLVGGVPENSNCEVAVLGPEGRNRRPNHRVFGTGCWEVPQ